MYVCICHGVDEQELRSHIADGACTTRRIAQRSGAGTACGMCVRRIACVLSAALADDRTRLGDVQAVVQFAAPEIVPIESVA